MKAPPGTRDGRRPWAAILALLAALAIFALVRWPGGDPPPGEDTATPPPATTTPTVVTTAPEATRTAETTAITPDPTPDCDLGLPHSFTLCARVVDALGLPVAGAWLFAAPPRCAFGRCAEPSDARGEVRLRCRGKTATLQLWVAVTAFGMLAPIQIVTLQADTELVLPVAVAGHATDPGDLVDRIDHLDSEDELRRLAQLRAHEASSPHAPRRGPEDTICGREIFLWRGIECRACHEPSKVTGYQSLRWAPLLAREYGVPALFRDLLLEEPPQRTQRELQQDLDQRRGAPERRLREEFGVRRIGSVQGTVRTPEGNGVPGVAVVWRAADGSVRMRSDTGPDGRYRIVLPATGSCTLLAAGGPHGRSEAVVAAVADATIDQDFVLESAQRARGLALGEQGEPLVDWHVRLVGADEPFAAIATTDAQGIFTCTHLPRTVAGTLWSRDRALRLPLARSELQFVPTDGLRLSVQAGTRARLRLHPRLPPGHRRARVEIRIRELASGYGALLEAHGFDDAFDIEGLGMGLYDGEIGAPGLGWSSFGPVHLDGRGLWDLGPLLLPESGILQFERAPDLASPLQRGAVFLCRRADTDVLTPPDRLDDDRCRLPVGDYAVSWQDGDRRRARAFTIRAGETTTLPIRD